MLDNSLIESITKAQTKEKDGRHQNLKLACFQRHHLKSKAKQNTLQEKIFVNLKSNKCIVSKLYRVLTIQ